MKTEDQRFVKRVQSQACLSNAERQETKSETQRIQHLEEALGTHANVCSSGGSLSHLPDILTTPYDTDYVGFIIMKQGTLRAIMPETTFDIKAGETAYFSQRTTLQLQQASQRLNYILLFYRSDTIRDIIGNSLLMMRLHSRYHMEGLTVRHTGPDDRLEDFVSLLHTLDDENTDFADEERKLLLMALTYRMCNIFSRNVDEGTHRKGRRVEIFERLLNLIGKNFMQHRDVNFYADKLCLSPKYLTTITRDICGYPLHQLIFRAIIRRSIFLLTTTSMTVQEIADALNFPNASAFGTFFKKHTGTSPKNYHHLTAEQRIHYEDFPNF
ncbi:MAG: helix-turn-helix domain-containing protein [Bacteroidales bacterium]|nr:helix-turn-helix domain-containing protein [Bacteroidales bacterium]